MIGKVVSKVVAPPAQIGDNRPKYLTKRGAPRRAIISRMIFAIKAIVDNLVTLGGQAFLLALAGTVGSVLAGWGVYCLFFKERSCG